MARVITFSSKFPAKHPKAGQATNFAELILNGGKIHTIRAGRRWKKGMMFSPRSWSGKPYCSKQVAIAPDMELTKVYNIEIFDLNTRYMHIGVEVKANEWYLLPLADVAKNDGLSIEDFEAWFNIHPKKEETFVGQILCWTNNIDYDKQYNP